ncbi:MAG: DUF1840 domain-containing protein [Gammaproteobacteria bacterium]|nr:DUF1840 domain-containing protein [Gammaproteobacteria bacterium]MBU0788267.1 DUF1840 domain-containing protein [Gammaproteobacteria bacterium]MBU0815236.1 DUF1840 domain-containing protein [Gammaproteobacteria bacterium]MBU1785656.1 DUF1840 domain-containing protein [Gammaproteobacteria bacterium]
MLYKFKSKATGDLIMLQPNGKSILEIIGKDATAASGIIQPPQMAAAIAALEAAVAREELARQNLLAEAKASGGDSPRLETISLRQRAQPFIDMLKRSLKEDKDIVWGV